MALLLLQSASGMIGSGIMSFVGIVLFILKIVIGIGLVINCARGLISREGMYDKDSTNMMLISQLIGIPFGAWLVANAFGFFDIPFIPFF